MSTHLPSPTAEECPAANSKIDASISDLLSELPVIDLLLWDELAAVIGPDACLLLATQFISCASNQLTCLQHALTTGNYEELGLKAHQFKGECRQLGAQRLGELYQIIEQLAPQKSNQLSIYLEHLQPELTQACQILSRIAAHEK